MWARTWRQTRGTGNFFVPGARSRAMMAGMRSLSPDAEIFLEDSWMMLGNIFASLLDLSRRSVGQSVTRRYYNFVLRRLRAGEAMLRRMILMLALTLEVEPILPRAQSKPSGPDAPVSPADSAPRPEPFGPRTPTPFLLWEADASRRQTERFAEPPRIWTLGMDWKLLPSELRALKAAEAPADISLQPLQLRLKRLELAFRDPDAAARRLARWRARQAGLRTLWRAQYECGEAEPKAPFGRTSPLGRARRLASRTTLPADYRQWLDDLDIYARDELINSS